VVNAYRRKYYGGLLVTPAIAVLFVMNIFPLLWSLGLSFFAYQSNQQSIRFVGMNNYVKALTNDIAAGVGAPGGIAARSRADEAAMASVLAGAVGDIGGATGSSGTEISSTDRVASKTRVVGAGASAPGSTTHSCTSDIGSVQSGRMGRSGVWASYIGATCTSMGAADGRRSGGRESFSSKWSRSGGSMCSGISTRLVRL
jgi:ABC-type sugar transport system permease subunit